MGITRRTFSLLLLCLLAPQVWGQDARRPATIVLSQPSVVEQLLKEMPDTPDRPHQIHDRIRTDEGRARADRVRSGRSNVVDAINKTGAQITGQTEIVLNSIHVLATPAQLDAIRKMAGVASADWAPQYHLFLDAAVPLLHVPQAWQALFATTGNSAPGFGVKVGVIDTGIDDTHPMFQDPTLPVPAGAMIGAAHTNSKIIVARSYICSNTPNCDPMDNVGHGTFVAGIIGGVQVQSPNPATAITGVAPKVYLGNYRIFDANSSTDGTKVLSAINDAVRDGMNIINLSLGTPARTSPVSDPNYQAVAAATNAGVLVVAAAGNKEPGEPPGVCAVYSPCDLPQAVCVGSVTNAQRYAPSVLINSSAPVPAALASLVSRPSSAPAQSTRFGPFPLVDVSSFDPTALGCAAFPPGAVQGAIALMSRGSCNFTQKISNAYAAGAVGVIIYDYQNQPSIVPMGTDGMLIPSVAIEYADGIALRSFLAQNQAAAAFDPTRVAHPAVADSVSAFSCRGPAPDQTLKPDLVAPGEYILSATQNNNTSSDMYSIFRYTVGDGTSFSTPMVSGIAALVKQAHPNWNPKQLKSAVVNTAIKLAAKTENGESARLLDAGAGTADALAAVTTKLLADPVSIIFDNRTLGVKASDTESVTIVNTGTADDFVVKVVPDFASSGVAFALDQNYVSIPSGGSVTLRLTMTTTAAPATASEGAIEIRSQSGGSVIRVPYRATGARPTVTAGGVVNSASYKSTAGIAPGSIISIFGSGLSSPPSSQAVTTPLPVTLGGTEVVINGTNAGIFYSSGTQVNLQIPYTIQSGSPVTASVKVDGTMVGFTANIADYNPGIFSMDGTGAGPGAIQKARDFSLVSVANPAAAGETVAIYATGLGALLESSPPAPGVITPSSPLYHTAATPTVKIDGQAVPQDKLVFSGLAPGMVGLYQVNVTIPQGLLPGAHDLVVAIGGVDSNAVTIYTQ